MKRTPLLIALSLSALLATAAADAGSCNGTSCGGGGDLIFRTPGEPPILLDLYTTDPGFQDRYPMDRTYLSPTAKTGRVGFDNFDIKKDPAYAAAVADLEKWKSTSPFLYGLLINALKEMKVRYTMDCISSADQKWIPAELKKRDPKKRIDPLIFYHPEIGPFISAENWNLSGEKSREAALIHEAFRQVQLTHGVQISNEKIQKLTGKLVLSNPKDKNDTLETQEYLDGGLWQWIETEHELVRRQEVTRKRACDALLRDNRLVRRPDPCDPSKRVSLAEAAGDLSLIVTKIGDWVQGAPTPGHEGTDELVETICFDDAKLSLAPETVHQTHNIFMGMALRGGYRQYTQKQCIEAMLAFSDFEKDLDDLLDRRKQIQDRFYELRLRQSVGMNSADSIMSTDGLFQKLGIQSAETVTALKGMLREEGILRDCENSQTPKKRNR